MTRPALFERSLAAVDPALAGQLHPTRNGSVDARSVPAGSGARLWWQCPTGHEWPAVVNARTRGAGCPSCAGLLPTPDTCLAAVDPALAGQWHPHRNGTLTPADVLPRTERRVWWQCPAAHEWAARVGSRTRGAGCPDCPRPPAARTPLAAHPHLVAQWDTAANGELTTAVASRSHRRVRWRCAHGHTWTAAVYSRTQGTGCPYCSGNRATPETSLAARHPDLLTDWDHDRNGTLDPATLRPGSNRRVWWRCPRDPTHSWQAQVAARTARATGCPVCTGRRITPQTSLAGTHPAVAAEWDPDANGTRTPATVHPASNTHAWWRCPAGHHWEAQIISRTTGGCGCPYCAGKLATPATSLAAVDPALAAQWDAIRNGDLTPASVRPGSNIRVWWQCPTGHPWRAQIGQRFRQRTGCPACASSHPHGRLLATTHPDLTAQWVDVLNGGGPGTLTTGSGIKAWWRCPTDPTHLWRTPVVSRTRGQTGCPFCAHKRPTPTTCLAAAAPDLIPEWHPTRNATLSPTDVLPHSGVPVWWQCPDHHEWVTAPANRLAGAGTGCPDCAARNRPPVRHQPAHSSP